MDDVFVSRLRSLVLEHGRYVRRAISKDATMMNWIMQRSGDLPIDASLAERIRCALHGSAERICERGERKTFRSIEAGYAFCAIDCACRRENQSKKIKAVIASLPAGEMEMRKEKRAATNLKRHGVEHVWKAGSAGAEARRRTMVERHGVVFPGSSKALRERRAENNHAKYGVANVSSLPEVKAKRIDTARQRYGVDNISQAEAIRAKRVAGNRERFGGNAPLSSETVRAKQAATMVELYGVDNASQSALLREKVRRSVFARFGVDHVFAAPEVRAAVIATNLQRYGAANPSSTPEVRERVRNTLLARFGGHPSRQHISTETLGMLEDEATLRGLLEKGSVSQIADELGVSAVLIGRRCAALGIDLPRSTFELALANILREQGFQVEMNDRSLIKPLELDLVVPERKLAIEICGLYWHSEGFRDRRYHVDKLNAVEAAGWRLVTIFEDELVHRRHIVHARLAALLGCAERGPGARECRIEQIDGIHARDFFEKHHIQGGRASGFVSFGAFDPSGVLCAAMSFSHPRRALSQQAGRVEMLRYATDGRILPGVASRLLAAFRRQHRGEVISFADRRWSDGSLYRTLGFRDVGATQPNYWYVPPSGVSREHRFAHRKDRLVAAGFDATLTEMEIMEQRRYRRVWDCGSYRFILSAC